MKMKVSAHNTKGKYSSFFFGFICFMTILTPLLIHAETTENRELIMGYEAWAPFLYIDNKGKLTGLDYELVSLALKEVDYKLTPFKVEVPWKRQLYWIKNGHLDIITGASKTIDREQYAYFSSSYRTESVSLFVRKGESNKIKLKSLAGILDLSFRLGAYLGSYYGEEFAELMKEPEFIDKLELVDDDKQNLSKLLSKRIDGVLLDSVAGMQLLRPGGEYHNTIERHPMAAIKTGDIFVMFSKESVPLETVKQFNKGLDEIRNNGSYKKIMDKYLQL